MRILILILFIQSIVLAKENRAKNLVVDFYTNKNINQLNYFTCGSLNAHKKLTIELMNENFIVSITNVDQNQGINFERRMQWNMPIGNIVDSKCSITREILLKVSEEGYFDFAHTWLVIADSFNGTENINNWIYNTFQHLNLSIDTDISVATFDGTQFEIYDVFNFGKIQGNSLEIARSGNFITNKGLKMVMAYKYYQRWNFHNLTLRGVTVGYHDYPNVPEDVSIMTDQGYNPRVPILSKITAQVLDVIREKHNFRFNYTFVKTWNGPVERNASASVTKNLKWQTEDISITSARMTADRKTVIGCFNIPTFYLMSNFYYIIPATGPGNYENRFLTPLSPGVWYCALLAGLLCAGLLAITALLEMRKQPVQYAGFTVLAAACQQAFEDGTTILRDSLKSQSAQILLTVIGLLSMLLYNYYTSSVVSWLLSAAPPNIHSIQDLMSSNLEIIFQDSGYSRSWFDDGHFFYFLGYANPVEDQLRDNILRTKRSTPLMLPLIEGFEKVRQGGFAYHILTYEASQEISRTFDDAELCKLGQLVLLPKSNVYILTQKKSPYKEFFNWSLLRIIERGHLRVMQHRAGGKLPECRGMTPRALSLGQAAPALLVLLAGVTFAVFIMVVEVILHRYQKYNRRNEQNSSEDFEHNFVIKYTE